MEETDWLDISADLADVDDNTLDSQEIDENMVMFEDMQLNNNNDDDDDDDGGMMEFDDGIIQNIILYINYSGLFTCLFSSQTTLTMVKNILTTTWLQLKVLLNNYSSACI